MKKIYDLKLHESHVINSSPQNKVTVLRVHGGWIYFLISDRGVSSTFVPYTKEEGQP